MVLYLCFFRMPLHILLKCDYDAFFMDLKLINEIGSRVSGA